MINEVIKNGRNVNWAAFSFRITAAVSCEGKTGVEMESLTAASVASLTVYDMCKSYGHEITILNTKLISKMKTEPNLASKMAQRTAVMLSRIKNVFKSK